MRTPRWLSFPLAVCLAATGLAAPPPVAAESANAWFGTIQWTQSGVTEYPPGYFTDDPAAKLVDTWSYVVTLFIPPAGVTSIVVGLEDSYTAPAPARIPYGDGPQYFTPCYWDTKLVRTSYSGTVDLHGVVVTPPYVARLAGQTFTLGDGFVWLPEEVSWTVAGSQVIIGSNPPATEPCPADSYGPSPVWDEIFIKLPGVPEAVSDDPDLTHLVGDFTGETLGSIRHDSEWDPIGHRHSNISVDLRTNAPDCSPAYTTFDYEISLSSTIDAGVFNDAVLTYSPKVHWCHDGSIARVTNPPPWADEIEFIGAVSGELAVWGLSFRAGPDYAPPEWTPEGDPVTVTFHPGFSVCWQPASLLNFLPLSGTAFNLLPRMAQIRILEVAVSQLRAARQSSSLFRKLVVLPIVLRETLEGLIDAELYRLAGKLDQALHDRSIDPVGILEYEACLSSASLPIELIPPIVFTLRASGAYSATDEASNIEFTIRRVY